MNGRDEREGGGRRGETTEPPVAECRTCGKVFDALEPVPRCPECDSTDVDLLS